MIKIMHVQSENAIYDACFRQYWNMKRQFRCHGMNTNSLKTDVLHKKGEDKACLSLLSYMAACARLGIKIGTWREEKISY